MFRRRGSEQVSDGLAGVHQDATLTTLKQTVSPVLLKAPPQEGENGEVVDLELFPPAHPP